MPERRILLGVIGRAHGVRGLVRVTSYADDLTGYGPLSDANGRRFVLRRRGEGVAEIAELIDGAEVKVADREAAERLTNTRLYVDRDRLPEPREDEFYLADLIGLAAFDGAGRRLGSVIAVHDYGAGASLEIEQDTGPPLLVPFTRASVPAVDVAAGAIVVDPPDEVGPPPLPQGDRENGRRGAAMTWRASVLTLFPEIFPGPLALSLAGRALRGGHLVAARGQHSRLRHRPPPHGGRRAVRRRRRHGAAARRGRRRHRLGRRRPAAGVPDAARAAADASTRCARFAAAPGVILLCGRYEGVDQRVIEARGMQEVSIGDYVLSGGELAALVLLDATVRLLPGVMGAADSAVEESFSHRLLEYPHYTRPADWQGRRVPEVLLSGDHAAIAAWRRAEAERLTRERRPDL